MLVEVSDLREVHLLAAGRGANNKLRLNRSNGCHLLIDLLLLHGCELPGYAVPVDEGALAAEYLSDEQLLMLLLLRQLLLIVKLLFARVLDCDPQVLNRSFDLFSVGKVAVGLVRVVWHLVASSIREHLLEHFLERVLPGEEHVCIVEGKEPVSVVVVGVAHVDDADVLDVDCAALELLQREYLDEHVVGAGDEADGAVVVEDADAVDGELVRLDDSLASVLGVPLLVLSSVGNALTARLGVLLFSLDFLIVSRIVEMLVDIDILPMRISL